LRASPGDYPPGAGDKRGAARPRGPDGRRGSAECLRRRRW